MKPLTVVFFSNFVDEHTRAERNITTDSPAASRKILNACNALKAGGAKPIILSMGRGRASGNYRTYGWTVKRAGQVPVVYAPFQNLRFLSEVISLLAPAFFILKRRKNRRGVLLIYNRTLFGIIPLLAARIIGWATVFDLEDGEIVTKSGGSLRPLVTLKQFGKTKLMKLYDRYCQRALLATSSLELLTSVRPTLPYYGSIDAEDYHPREIAKKLCVLFSGTVTPLTGSTTLSKALIHLAQEHPSIVQSLVVHVTGYGSGIEELQRLTVAYPDLQLYVHGRVSTTDYKTLLRQANVGLSLKEVSGQYADTTFPSKTVEYAAAGLHVISTDIGDVRKVLGENATYLTSDDPRELSAAIAKVVARGPAELEEHSRILHDHLNNTLSFEKTGRDLIEFLEKAIEHKT